MSNQAPTAARYAGARVQRVEDRRLLTGHGTYVDDIVLPRMLHACFVRSPFARAAIRGIDTVAALGEPGVRFVFTAADLNGDAREQWHTAMGKESPETPRPPLAGDEVRFVGDPVALVVADTRAQAEDAAELVDVDYEALPAVVDYTAAEDAGELVHAAHGSNVVGIVAGRPLDSLAEVFGAAAHVVRETIYQQAYVASPLEGRGLVVDCSTATGEITIYAATQGPHEVRLFCARLLGVAEQKVRVIMRDTGGGFGQKVMVQRDEMCIMLAAPKVGAPLKWVEDRRENLLAAGKSRQEHGDVRMAFTADGEITGMYLDFVQDCGAYPTPWPVSTAGAVGAFFPGPYRVPKAGFTAKTIYTNTVGRCAYRGPWQFETLAREVIVDIAARRMGIDPADLRRRNLLSHADLPYRNPNGLTYDNVSPLETLEQALEILDYDAFRKNQAEARTAGRYLGVGISSYVEASTPGAGSWGTEAATIRIEPSGAINVYLAGGSTGNSLETTVAQLAADALGADIDDVNTIQGDTALTGYGAGTGGSRSASMTAGAVRETATILCERIRSIAAHRLEAAVDDIELGESRATVRGTPAIGLSFAEIAALAYFQPQALPPGVPAGLEAAARYTASSPSIWVNATHVCTCEVDTETGRVELVRYIVSEDCGPMINPAVVEGQIAGGVAEGIGGVLYEHLVYDERGNPLTTSLMDYLMPSAAELPPIEYGHIETPSPGPGGYKGVGEGGAIGAPAAVVNAVADALAPFGVECTQLPLSPQRIVELLQSSEKEGSGAVTNLSYDPYTAINNPDPYPLYQRLRDEAPLYYNEQYDFYAVSRYEDCERGLVDSKRYISGKGGVLELIKADMELPPGTLIFEDPPAHTVHRSLLARVFTPRRVSALEPKIREFCADSLDPLAGAAEFDLIADLGAQMPMRVIGMLFGIPESDQATVRDQADARLRTTAGEAMHVGANPTFGSEAFEEYIDWRIEHPSDDLMTDLLHSEFEDEHGVTRTLTREEALLYTTVVAGAGNETTTRLIGWAGKVLAEHPDQRREVVADRSLVNNTIEELLRYESPGPQIGRYVPAATEVHGETIPAGACMMFIVSAANRDERRWPDADRFDIHREIGPHLAFGYGIHFCLGAALARLQGRIALDELLNRFPEWDVDLDRARIAPTSTVRGYETLPVLVP